MRGGLPWFTGGLSCGLPRLTRGLPGGSLLGLGRGEAVCMLSDDTDSVAVDEFDAFVASASFGKGSNALLLSITSGVEATGIISLPFLFRLL